MGMLKKTGKWLMLGFAGLAAIALVLYGASRFRGPTQEQRAAMALLTEKPPVEGRNAFGALWLLPYDVPAEQIDAITAEDAARFAKLPSTTDSSGETEYVSHESVAARSFGPPATYPAGPALCRFGPGCLAKIAGTREQAARWRDDNTKLVARLATLSEYGHFRNQFVPRADMPMPAFAPLQALPVLRALDHLEGRHDAALTGVCRDITMWRQLSKDTDSLVFSMVAAAGVRTEAMLMADMLAELPAAYPVPAACTTAFKVSADAEFNICSVMRGEVGWAHTLMTEIQMAPQGPLESLRNSLFFDEAATRAGIAPRYAWPCSTEILNAVARDARVQAPVSRSPGVLSLECLANAAGCLLISVNVPNFNDYLRRRQDVGAWLRLMRTLLTVRADRDNGLALTQGLAKLSDNAPGASRNVRVTDDGNALSIPLFDTTRGTEARLTLRRPSPPPPPPIS